MGAIDVSELMLDPDFIETLPVVVITRAAAVNNFGQNVLTETSRDIVAVVEAAGGETLKRLPEGAQASDYITVYTKATLAAQPVGGYADIVVWKNQRFQVEIVTDWSNWGAGWTQADCLIIRPSK